jgi:hypothetical protein
MGKIVNAKLISRYFSNGVEAFSESVPLGKTYRVDISRKRVFTNINLDTFSMFEVTCVPDVDAPSYNCWLPLECLDVGGH